METPTTEPHFDGETYKPEHDHARLTSQLARVRKLMSDGAWRTLEQIGTSTGSPPASVSARLRDLRKSKFGALAVDRRNLGDRDDGAFEYRLRVAKVTDEQPASVKRKRLDRLKNESLRRELAASKARVEALDQLVACFRLGKRPSERLHRDLRKTSRDLIVATKQTELFPR